MDSILILIYFEWFKKPKRGRRRKRGLGLGFAEPLFPMW
jgi:hypothetical protein